MPLNGIDIASWQEGIDVAKVQADFVIVKVTGGTGYVNPYWRKWADAVLKSGKLLGLYHYAVEYGEATSGKKEAEFFWKQVKDYKGKFIPCLDWEADACGMPVSYAKEWLDNVAAKSGSTPMFYSYASYVNDANCKQISSYPLWLAGYPYKYENGKGYVKDPDLIYGTGDWKKAECYQYSSTRTIPGYDGRLDVNYFYGDRKDWLALQSGDGSKEDIVQKQPNEIAAIIMKDMCDNAANGYSQDPRWGEDGAGMRTLVIDGRKYSYDQGSYDCASAIITAWSLALSHTKYKGALDDATYTGNMRSVFHNSKLFDIWDTDTTVAKTGDVYLNDSSHTAMCIDDDPDLLAEFSINEKGGIVGGKVGDQTGYEAYVHEFYEYPWNVTLHYNGKADFPKVAPKPQPSEYPDGKYETIAPDVHVRASRKVASKSCCILAKGNVLQLKDIRKNGVGSYWGEIAEGDHKGRFVCVKNSKGIARIK